MPRQMFCHGFWPGRHPGNHLNERVQLLTKLRPNNPAFEQSRETEIHVVHFRIRSTPGVEGAKTHFRWFVKSPYSARGHYFLTAATDGISTTGLLHIKPNFFLWGFRQFRRIDYIHHALQNRDDGCSCTLRRSLSSFSNKRSALTHSRRSPSMARMHANALTTYMLI